MEDSRIEGKKLKVAVTGGAGSGKSTVCKRLKELGAYLISSDELARQVVVPGSLGLKQIVAHFGETVLNPDKTLNRHALRSIMISDPESRKRLESLIHPEILKQMNLEIEKAEHTSHPIIVIEVPLLFEGELAHLFDHVVMVAADSQQKIDRLMERDRVSETDAQHLIDIQLSDEVKISRSDTVIQNNKSLKELLPAVDDLYGKLMENLSETA